MRSFDDFPFWSVWIRDYAEDYEDARKDEEAWVLFVVEGRGSRESEDQEVVRCRVVAAAPGMSKRGTLGPGAEFDFDPRAGTFADRVRRVA